MFKNKYFNQNRKDLKIVLQKIKPVYIVWQ